MIGYHMRSVIIKQFRLKLSSKFPTGSLYYSTHHRKPEGRKHYYEVIGVPENASQTQVKNAYYRLSKIYHPDVTKDPYAQERFHEIQEAYEVLGSVYSRRMYDRGLVLPSQKQTAAKRRKAKDEEEVQVDPLRRKQEKQAPVRFGEWSSDHYTSSIRKMRSRQSYREKEDEFVRDRMEQYQEKAKFVQTHTSLVPMYILLIIGALILYKFIYIKPVTTDEVKPIKKKKKELEELPQNKDTS